MLNNETIPKKIHYCWIGGNEKPDSVKRCIESWKKYASDYEIIEWNESNFNFNNCNDYVKEAIREKKWAFVTDYMRLYILYNEGGVYLDTDVELVKNIDSFLLNKSFLCMESLNTICTACIGSIKKQMWIKELIELYNGRKFIDKDGRIDLTPNSIYIYDFLMKRYNLTNVNSVQVLDCNLVVYTSDYFSPKNYSTMKMEITNNTYAIHHYGGIWKSNKAKAKDYILALITRVIGEENRAKIKKRIKNK